MAWPGGDISMGHGGGLRVQHFRVGVACPYSRSAMHIVFAGWPASRSAPVLPWSASACSRDIRAGAHGRLTAASNFTNADPGRRAGLRPNVNGDGGPADGGHWGAIPAVTGKTGGGHAT